MAAVVEKAERDSLKKEEVTRPCLLCASKLSSDKAEFHLHVNKSHNAEKECDILFKLFQLDKDGMDKTMAFLSDLMESNFEDIEPEEIVKCEIKMEEDDDGEDSEFMNFLSEGYGDSEDADENNSKKEPSDAPSEEEMMKYFKQESSIEASETGEKKKGKRLFTMEERKFCVDFYRKFELGERTKFDKSWYDRFSTIFLQMFPSRDSAPNRETVHMINKKFEKFNSLENQFKGNSGKRPTKVWSNICDECGYVAKTAGRQDLYMHKKRYHEPWKECPVCGKTVFNLIVHQRSHLPESERKYKCEQCGKGFIHTQHLKQHMKTVHSDERPHVCQFMCGYSCKIASNLRKHEKICKNNK